MSVPRLMVESALQGRWRPTERQRVVAELWEARRLLASVATNLKQLARAAKISAQVPERERLERTLDQVDELVLQLPSTEQRRR